MENFWVRGKENSALPPFVYQTVNRQMTAPLEFPSFTMIPKR